MAWLGLLATVGWNYVNYRRGRLTICATTRRALPRPVSALALALGYAYLAAHVWRGYQPKETPWP